MPEREREREMPVRLKRGQDLDALDLDGPPVSARPTRQDGDAGLGGLESGRHAIDDSGVVSTLRWGIFTRRLVSVRPQGPHFV